MCDLTNGFRLCSCEGEALKFPDWILERRDADRPLKHLRGRAAIPQLETWEKRLFETLSEALNRGDCFDFDYTPVEGDILRIKRRGTWFRLIWSEGTWRRDRSTSLTSWRSQMVVADQGLLEPDPPADRSRAP